MTHFKPMQRTARPTPYTLTTRWPEPYAIPDAHETWRMAQARYLTDRRNDLWFRRAITAMTLLLIMGAATWITI